MRCPLPPRDGIVLLVYDFLRLTFSFLRHFYLPSSLARRCGLFGWVPSPYQRLVQHRSPPNRRHLNFLIPPSCTIFPRGSKPLKVYHQMMLLGFDHQDHLCEPLSFSLINLQRHSHISAVCPACAIIIKFPAHPAFSCQISVAVTGVVWVLE